MSGNQQATSQGSAIDLIAAAVAILVIIAAFAILLVGICARVAFDRTAGALTGRARGSRSVA